VDPSLISDEALTDLEKAVAAFLVESDDAKAKALFDKRIGPYRNLGLPLFARMMAQTKPATGMRAGTQPRTVNIRTGVGDQTLDVPYTLAVPRRAVTGQRVPLLISLVPSWMNARSEPIAWTRLQEANDAIVASVDAPAGHSWANGPLAVAITDAIRRDVIDTYNVDAARITLTAASDATPAAWHVAMHRADRFAAMVVRAASPPPERAAEALHHLSVLAIHGSADDQTRVRVIQDGIAPLRAAGWDVTLRVENKRKHEAFTDMGPEIAEWLADRPRSAQAWQTAALALTPEGNSGYWLEITGIADVRTSEWVTQDPNNATHVLERRVELQTPARASAEFGQIGQKITITTENVTSLRLRFNGSTFDLSKPVDFIVNGKTTTLTPLATADPVSYLLDYARRTGDRASRYWCEVVLPVPQ
jgi:poly(3-hydroxybutyrate) depolymerase